MQIKPHGIARNSITDFYFLDENIKDKNQLCSMTIKGTYGGKEYSYTLNANDGYKLSNSKHLHAVATNLASNQEILSEEKEFQLASNYTLLTKRMSLILYDNETQHNETMQEQVVIPVLHYAQEQYAPSRLYSLHANAMPRAKYAKQFSHAKVTVASRVDMDDESSGDFESIQDISHKEDYCSALTNSQFASGEWKNISALIKKILGKDETDQDLMSAIAIVYLQHKCSTSYSLLAQKGKTFLINKLGEKQTLLLLEKAQNLLNV